MYFLPKEKHKSHTLFITLIKSYPQTFNTPTSHRNNIPKTANKYSTIHNHDEIITRNMPAINTPYTIIQT